MKVEERIINEIDKYLEHNQQRRHSVRLGASGIGAPCARSLWYSFRWCKGRGHQGRILRLLERGNLEESRVYQWLENIGCAVSHRQSEYIYLDGHFVAYIDGVVDGLFLPEPMILSIKTHNDRNFKQLKKGVQFTYPTHYAQSQMEMELVGLSNTLYFAVNKNDDNIYLEIIPRDPAQVDVLKRKMVEVVYNKSPPERAYPNSAYVQCKLCNYRKICWGQEIPLPNCRTCRFSEAVPQKNPVEKFGAWSCKKDQQDIIERSPESGCILHVYNSYMLQEYRLEEEKEDCNVYHHFETGRLIQGPHNKTSNELYEESARCGYHVGFR